jgi:hypothetical protein
MSVTRLLLPAVIFAVAVTGCVSKTTVSTSPVNQAPAPPGATTGPAKAPAHKAGLGDAIDLAGNSSGEKIRVTLVKIVDPAHSTDGFSTPAAGSRYVGVQVRILNTGTVAYTDSPDNDVKAMNAAGEAFTPVIVLSTDAGQPFPAGMSVAPGGVALGVVIVQVPVAVKAVGVQYTMDSGFGNTGQWLLG